ncbi:MAG: addiction module protein [Pirellulales bacterium]
MSTVDRLRERLLTLPIRQRAALATLLLESLEAEPLDGSSQQAWKEEAESRSLAYSQGQLTASDWRESVDRIRQVLAQRRKL